MSDSSAAAQWKDKGNAAFRLQQYDEAVQLYSRGLEADPSNCVLLANRAAALLALGKLKEALEDAGAAIAANPLYWRSYSRKSQALSRLADRQDDAADRSRLLRDAVACLQEGQRCVPEVDRPKLEELQHDLDGRLAIDKIGFKTWKTDEFSIVYLPRWQVHTSSTPGTTGGQAFKYYSFCDNPSSDAVILPLMMLSVLPVDPESNMEQSLEEQLMSFVLSRGLSPENANIKTLVVKTDEGPELHCRTTTIRYKLEEESELVAVATGTRGLVLMMMFHFTCDKDAGLHRLVLTRMLQSISFHYKPTLARKRKWALLRNVVHREHHHFKLDVSQNWTQKPVAATCSHTDQQQLLSYSFEWGEGSGTMSLEVATVGAEETLDSRRDHVLRSNNITTAVHCDETLGDLLSTAFSYFLEEDRSKFQKVIIGRTTLGMQHFFYTLVFTFSFGVPLPSSRAEGVQDPDVERDTLLWVCSRTAQSFEFVSSELAQDVSRVVYEDFDRGYRFSAPATLVRRAGSGPAVWLDLATKETISGRGVCNLTMLELPLTRANLDEAQQVIQQSITQLSQDGRDEHYLLGRSPVMMRTAIGTMPTIGTVKVRFCTFNRRQCVLGLFLLSSGSSFHTNWKLVEEVFRTIEWIPRREERPNPCACLSENATVLAKSKGDGVFSSIAGAVGSFWK